MNDRRRNVLELLSCEPISGPAMAEELDVSRAAIWKHIEALREEGYAIESTEDGYELVDTPEFGAVRVEHQLSAPFTVEYHDEIGSTNGRGKELAMAGESNVVVLANEQTGGRGRLDRKFSSPPGGIWLSLVCCPDISPQEAPIYTLAGAVATSEALRGVGVDAGIKWPNDILVDGRKIVGILTEMQGEADRVSWIIVGIGINANIDADCVPETATTIREQVGDIDRSLLTQRIIERFEELRSTPAEVMSMWRELSVTLGQRVRVETPNETIVGDAVDIEFPGTLVVATADGERRVSAGDCEHLRPVPE